MSFTTYSLIPAKKSDIFIAHIFCITDFQKNLYPCLCKPNFDPKKHSGCRATARPNCIRRTAECDAGSFQKREQKKNVTLQVTKPAMLHS